MRYNNISSHLPKVIIYNYNLLLKVIGIKSIREDFSHLIPTQYQNEAKCKDQIKIKKVGNLLGNQ